MPIITVMTESGKLVTPQEYLTMKSTPIIATRANMKRAAVDPGKAKAAFAYSPSTGERYSANPHDYTWLTGDPLTDSNGDPLVLAVLRDEVEVLTETDLGAELAVRLDERADMKSTTGLNEDVPFEPQFGDMSHEQLLAVVRRYHWMLAELEALAPDSETNSAGNSYEVDQVSRDDDATYVTFWGTGKTSDGRLYPYIIGEV